MTRSFTSLVTLLRSIYGRFEPDSILDTIVCLRQLRTVALRENATLLVYHECLLFLRAYPANGRMLSLVESELKRIATFMRGRRGREHSLESVGLPYVSAVTRFSHDCVRWLAGHPHCAVTFEEFSESTLDLNAVLRLTLPTLERSETNAELPNDDLLDVLGVRPERRLDFLIAELSRLDDTPYVKDQLFDALGVSVRVTPTHSEFSTAFNRLP
ncbi:MAG: hypothetical protein ABMA00_15125, partial [Gemmatimonas sp.]